MKYEICLNKKKYVVEIQGENAKILSKAPMEDNIDDNDLGLPDFDFGGEDENASLVTAALPGTVLAISIKVGQSVKKGDTLLILESMKMENAIPAPQDGTVASVNVAKGASVNAGDLLVSLN